MFNYGCVKPAGGEDEGSHQALMLDAFGRTTFRESLRQVCNGSGQTAGFSRQRTPIWPFLTLRDILTATKSLPPGESEK